MALSAEGAQILQPRATPWEWLFGKDASPIGSQYDIPRLQRLTDFDHDTQGVALGCFMSPLPGLAEE